jgi:DNA modification methylase
VTWTIHQGDCIEQLRELPDESIHCCVTSPPYWGLRDYGVDGQLGLEETPEQFIDKMVAVFAEVRRVLRADGTCWVNIGDTYAMRAQGQGQMVGSHDGAVGRASRPSPKRRIRGDLKNKDLVGIPWMLAFALRADGWYLRRDIIWSKPNPMPESVTDRPTSAHEYLFLLTKSPRYFYDAEAIREPLEHPNRSGTNPSLAAHTQPGNTFQIREGERTGIDSNPAGRNKRSVWTIATRPYPEAHFATFPPDLVEPCVLAGTSPKVCGGCGAPWERRVGVSGGTIGKSWSDHADDLGEGKKGGGDLRRGLATYDRRTLGWQPTCDHADDSGRAVVLDPFSGAATTGLVATQLGRDFIGIELNPEYVQLGEDRIKRWEANPAGHLSGDPEPVEGQLGLELTA